MGITLDTSTASGSCLLAVTPITGVVRLILLFVDFSAPGSVLLLTSGITPRLLFDPASFFKLDNCLIGNVPVPAATVAGEVIFVTSLDAVSCVAIAGAAVACICVLAPSIVAKVSLILA